MAESTDEDFVPEIPAYADKLLFAEVLVEYLLLRNCQNYNVNMDKMQTSDHTYSAFDRIIKRAITFLDDTLELDHDTAFFAMQDANFINSYNYGRFADNLAVKYFPEGFDAKYFLIYCVNLSTMAAYFYNHGVFDAPDLAKKHIFHILEEYGMTAGGWDTVRRIAENYEKMERDFVNELTPQSLDSDDDQDWPQEEVSDDESNSLLNEEHNSSPGNEETNLKEKQERECLQKNQSLKESAQCSSESKSAVGLSPLKEPGLPSEEETISSTLKLEENKSIRSELNDMLRPGTSNVQQKPNLSKNDCKVAMNLSRNNMKSDGNFQICFAGNKLIDKSASDGRFYPGSSSACQESVEMGKTDCKRRKLDLLLNMKDNEHADRVSFEEDELIDKNLSNGMLCTEASNTYQISNFKIRQSCKRKLDLSSDKENGGNYPSMNSDGNNVASKSSPNKFFPGTQNSDQMSVTGKRKYLECDK